MIDSILKLTDRLLGRGDAAITVPVFDGPLKANNVIEAAEVLDSLEAAQDLATDGQHLFVANGTCVLRYKGNVSEKIHDFEAPVTAIACLPDGGIAVSLAGREVLVVGGDYDGRRWGGSGDIQFYAVNAITASTDGLLLVTDGSVGRSTAHWKTDLMSLGASGRVFELNLANGNIRSVASGLSYAYGVCYADGAAWVSESWRHRLVAFRNDHLPKAVISGLPGYPSRLSPAAGGGYWLTCFVLRTQLVEFVLREHSFRKRMLKEVEPQYWIAPALNSGNTFLEPMQGAHLKMMGVVKPWAPPRSYGLIIRLNKNGEILYSLHSRFDGKNHGVVAAVECQGNLYALAQGSQRILKLPLAEAERSVRA